MTRKEQVVNDVLIAMRSASYGTGNDYSSGSFGTSHARSRGCGGADGFGNAGYDQRLYY